MKTQAAKKSVRKKITDKAKATNKKGIPFSKLMKIVESSKSLKIEFAF